VVTCKSLNTLNLSGWTDLTIYILKKRVWFNKCNIATETEGSTCNHNGVLLTRITNQEIQTFSWFTIVLTGHLVTINVLGGNTVSITLTDFHCAFILFYYGSNFAA
jgi:hypothetical protein